MDIIWVRNLLKELVPQQKLPPTPLLCDNQAVLDNVRGDKNSKRLKHCMLKLTLLREHESKAINMQKIHTKENVADIFTKPLHRGPFEHLREALLTAGQKNFRNKVKAKHYYEIVVSYVFTSQKLCFDQLLFSSKNSQLPRVCYSTTCPSQQHVIKITVLLRRGRKCQQSFSVSSCLLRSVHS